MLIEEHQRGIDRRRSAAAIAARKASAPSAMPDWVVTQPISAELTVTSVNPNAASGQAEQILAWPAPVLNTVSGQPDLRSRGSR